MNVQECKEMKILEDALRDADTTLRVLLSVLDQTDDVKKRLFEFNISTPFLVINYSCGRNDRNVIHLEQAWSNHFAEDGDLPEKEEVLSYDDFCLTRVVEATKLMSLDDLGHYHSQLGMSDDCEVDVIYSAFLMYGTEQEYHIDRMHDGTFALVLGNQEYEGTIAQLEAHLYNYYLAEVSHD